MKPSSLLRLSLLSLVVSANSVTPPSAPSSSQLPPPPPPDATLRTITISRASTTTTATLSMLLPPSAPRPPLAGATNRLDLRADDAPPAPPAPGITPAPDADAAAAVSGDDGWQTGMDANGDLFRFRQTTYYSCVTQGTYSHCGWHRPILEVSGAVAGNDDGRRLWGFGAKVVVAVGAAAGVVLVGW